jgi:hypothetical protein
MNFLPKKTYIWALCRSDFSSRTPSSFVYVLNHTVNPYRQRTYYSIKLSNYETVYKRSQPTIICRLNNYNALEMKAPPGLKWISFSRVSFNIASLYTANNKYQPLYRIGLPGESTAKRRLLLINRQWLITQCTARTLLTAPLSSLISFQPHDVPLTHFPHAFNWNWNQPTNNQRTIWIIMIH